MNGVKLDVLLGHGGLFKTKGVGQKIMAAAAGVPVDGYGDRRRGRRMGRSTSCRLPRMERRKVRAWMLTWRRRYSAVEHGTVMEPDAEDVKGFDEFMVRYHAGLPIERSAVETMPEK